MSEVITYCDATGNVLGYATAVTVLDECTGTATTEIKYISTAGADAGASLPATWELCNGCCPERSSAVVCWTPAGQPTIGVQIVTLIATDGTITNAAYRLDGSIIAPYPPASELGSCTDGASDSLVDNLDGTFTHVAVNGVITTWGETPTTLVLDPLTNVIQYVNELGVQSEIELVSTNPNLVVDAIDANTIEFSYDLCADAADSFADANRTPLGTDGLLAIDASGACVRVDPPAAAAAFTFGILGQSAGSSVQTIASGDQIEFNTGNANLTIVSTAGDVVTFDYDLCADAAGSFADANRAALGTDGLLAIDASGACVRVDPPAGAAAFTFDILGQSAGSSVQTIASGDQIEFNTGNANLTIVSTAGDVVTFDYDLCADAADSFPNAARAAVNTDLLIGFDATGACVALTPPAGGGGGGAEATLVADTDCINLTLTGTTITAAPIVAPSNGACTTNGLSCTSTGMWVAPNPVHVVTSCTTPARTLDDSTVCGAAPTPATVSMTPIDCAFIGGGSLGGFVGPADGSRITTTALGGLAVGDIIVAMTTGGGTNGAGGVGVQTVAGGTTTWKAETLATQAASGSTVQSSVLWSRVTSTPVSVESILGYPSFTGLVQFYKLTGVNPSFPFTNAASSSSSSGFDPVDAGINLPDRDAGPAILFTSTLDAAAGYPFDRFYNEHAGGYVAVPETSTCGGGSGAVGIVSAVGDPSGAVSDVYKTEMNAGGGTGGGVALHGLRANRAYTASALTTLDTCNVPALANPDCNPSAIPEVQIAGAGSGLSITAGPGSAFEVYVEVDGVDYLWGALDNSTSDTTRTTAVGPFSHLALGATVAAGASSAAHTIRTKTRCVAYRSSPDNKIVVGPLITRVRLDHI